MPSGTCPRSRFRSCHYQRRMCAICKQNGVDRPSQSFAWCKGLCKEHARSMGYQEPGRSKPARAKSLSGQRPRAYCKDCIEEGITRKCQSDAWCRGFCMRHATQRGYRHAPSFGSVRHAPAASALLVQAGTQRRRSCQEAGCLQAARCKHAGLHVCAAHATWRRRFTEYRQYLASSISGCPPGTQTTLGLWMRRQLKRMFLKMLASSQTSMLQSLPKYQQSPADFLRQHYQDARTSAREFRGMRSEDLDYDSVVHKAKILKRDMHLLDEALAAG